MFREEVVKGIILNVVPMTFKNEGREDTHMTQIMYALPAPSSERFKGFAIMKGFAIPEAFEKLDSLMKKNDFVNLKIQSLPTDNGSKFKVIAVNDILLK